MKTKIHSGVIALILMGFSLTTYGQTVILGADATYHIAPEETITLVDDGLGLDCPGCYSHNSDYRTDFTTDAGYVIKATVARFDVEDYYDGLFYYDGGTTQPLTGGWDNDPSPIGNEITSTDETGWGFRFISDGSVAYDGWEITLTSEAAPVSEVWVATTGDDSNDGSESNPYLTLSAAISGVASGGTINVGAGTFEDIGGHSITSGLTITGAGMNSTIFTGDQSDRFMTINSNNVTLEKMTITNYKITTSCTSECGGGAVKLGTAYTTQYSGIKIKDVYFLDNITDGTSGDGGAIDAGVSMVDIVRCKFVGNMAGSEALSGIGRNGGAIRTYRNTTGETHAIQINACLFYDNRAQGYGAAISNWYGNGLEIFSCTFSDNTAYYDVSYNATVWQNGNWSGTHKAKMWIYNSIIYNTQDAEYDIADYSSNSYNRGWCYSVTYGTQYSVFSLNDVSTSDPGFFDRANDDYTLASASGCIDAGDDTYHIVDGKAWNTGLTVADQIGGIKQGTVDKGCFEYCAAGAWDGSASSDLSNASNWDVDHPRCVDITITSDGTAPDLSGGPLTIYGDLVVNSGATLTISSNEKTSYLAVKGNLTNSGTITHSGAAKIKFNGSTAQTITSGGSTLKNVELNNSSGASLGDNTTISGTLTLTSGVLNTNNNRLTMTSTTTGDLSGYTNANFIQASQTGPFRRHIASNTDTYVFPVGNGTSTSNYFRMDMINGSLSGNGFTYLDVYVKTNTETGNNVDSRITASQGGTAITNMWDKEWMIVPDNEPSSGTFGIRLYTENISGLVDNKFTVFKRADGSTDYADYGDGVSTSTSIPSHNAAGRTVASGYAEKTGFEPPMAGTSGGEGDDNLPIQLLDFKADLNEDGGVDLIWTTASEVNNEYFSIERSTDGLDFEPVLERDGAGNSNQLIEYAAIDENPLPGTSYYRLKQTDYDGSYAYSELRAINVLKELNFSVKPNPATDRLQITFGEIAGGSVFVMTPEYKAKIRIYNIAGKLVYKKKFDGTFYKFNIDVSNFDEGMYLVNLETAGQVYKTKFVKE